MKVTASSIREFYKDKDIQEQIKLFYPHNGFNYEPVCKRLGLHHFEKLVFGGITQLNLPFYPQYPIGPFLVDFCEPILKLVLEIDGEYHSTTEQKEMDTARELYMISLGWKIERFTNAQVESGVLFDYLCKLRDVYKLAEDRGGTYERLSRIGEEFRIRDQTEFLAHVIL